MTVSSVCGFWCQLLVFRVESNKKNNMKFASWVVFVIIYFPLGVLILYTETVFSFFPILFFRLILLGKHTSIIIIYVYKKGYAPSYYILYIVRWCYWCHLTRDIFTTSECALHIIYHRSCTIVMRIYVADTLLGNIIMMTTDPSAVATTADAPLSSDLSWI